MDVRLSVPDTRSDGVHARVPAPAIPVVDLKAPEKSLFGKVLKKKSSKVNFGSHDVGRSARGRASGDATSHNKSLPGQLSVNIPYKPNVQAPYTRSSDDAATLNNGSVDQVRIKKPYKPNVEASDMTSNDAAMHKKGVVGQIVDKESSKGEVEGPDMPPSVSVNKSGSAPVTRSVGVGTRKKGMFGAFLEKKPSKG